MPWRQTVDAKATVLAGARAELEKAKATESRTAGLLSSAEQSRAAAQKEAEALLVSVRGQQKEAGEAITAAKQELARSRDESAAMRKRAQDEVVAAEALHEVAMTHARDLAELPAVAFAATKQSAHKVLTDSLSAGLDADMARFRGGLTM